MSTKLKLVLVALGKLAVLYFMALLIWIDVVLLHTAWPRMLFEVEPFLHAAALLTSGATLVSLKAKSRAPMLWAIFSIGFSSLYIPDAGFYGYLEFFVIALSAAAGINFLYRNRITEPLLVLLPILTVGWLFLQLVYTPYVLVWVSMKTGYMSVSEAISRGLSIDQLWVALLVVPLMLMYLLGKHGYNHIRQYMPNWTQSSVRP